MKDCARCKNLFDSKGNLNVLYCSKTCKQGAYRARHSASKKSYENIVESILIDRGVEVTVKDKPSKEYPQCGYCGEGITSNTRKGSGYCSKLCSANDKVRKSRSNINPTIENPNCSHCNSQLSRVDSMYCSDKCESAEMEISRIKRLYARISKDREDYEYREMFRVAKSAMELRLMDYDKQKANEIIELAGRCHTPWKRSFLSITHAKMYYDKPDQKLYRCTCGGLHYTTIKPRRNSW